MEDDWAYYRRRADEEERAAAAAADEDIRRCHLELARLLAARVEAPDPPAAAAASQS